MPALNFMPHSNAPGVRINDGEAPAVRPHQYPEYHASYGNPLQTALYNPVMGPIMGLLNYAANKFSPTVNAGTYTAVDGSPQPRVTAAVGDVLHAVAAVDQHNSLATRVYKQAVLDHQPSITQNGFSDQELSGLRTAAARAQADGRNAISFHDYLNPELPKALAARAAGGPMPMMMPKARDTGDWANIIGRAKLEQRPDGTHVVDTYDFNNYEDPRASLNADGSSSPEHFAENSALSPIYAAAWFGRRALPSGLRGAPVDINLGMPRR